MAYIGAEPVPGQNREVDDISSSFNGSTTAFTLQVSGVNVSPESANNILVNIGGVLQNPGTDYTIAASTITFTTAPASGLSFFALVLGAGINTATVADQTIGASKLLDTAVTTNKIADQAVTLAKLPHGTSSNDGKFLRANNGADPTFETVSGTTINNNADNRVITGSGTANTLNGESALTFDGTLLKLQVDSGEFRVEAANGVDAFSVDSDNGNTVIGGSGTLTIPDTIVHAGDTDTKIRFSGANEIKVETGGAQRLKLDGSEVVFNDDGADVDLRIEGDTDTNLFKVDAGNDRVGIGTSTPASKLGVDGKVTVNGDANVNSVEVYADTTSGQSFGMLVDAGTTSADYVANFRLANNNPSVFLRGDGNIGIGTTNCGTPVEIKHATATHNVVAINRANDDAPALMLGNDSSHNALIATNSADLRFGRDSAGTFTERLRMLNGGGLTFGGETTAAHALDDYEEASWTPVVHQGIDGGATYVVQRGWSVKIGSFVHYSFFLKFNGTGNGNHFKIAGLPFTSANNPYSAAYSSGGSVTYSNANYNNSNAQSLFMGNASTVLDFYNNHSGTTSISGSANNQEIYGFGMYRTDT